MTRLIEAAREVVLCAITSITPPGCLPDSHPAVQLLQLPCPHPDMALDGRAWKLARWGGDEVCWLMSSSTAPEVTIVSAGQPLRRVIVRGDQAACLRIACNPDETIQTGAKRGSLRK
jgi:hypothetical protein